jgi:hypothetical protein
MNSQHTHRQSTGSMTHLGHYVGAG